MRILSVGIVRARDDSCNNAIKTRCAVLAHVVQNKEHLTLGVDRRSCSPSRPRSEVLQSLGDLVLGQKDRFVALPDLQCLGQQRPGAASGCV